MQQAEKEWNLHLHKGLLKLKCKQSKTDPCLYYQRDTLLEVNIDDCILKAKTEKLFQAAIKEIAKIFEIADKGEID